MKNPGEGPGFCCLSVACPGKAYQYLAITGPGLNR